MNQKKARYMVINRNGNFQNIVKLKIQRKRKRLKKQRNSKRCESVNLKKGRYVVEVVGSYK